MEFKILEGYSAYEINTNGEIRNIKSGRIMKIINIHGYNYVKLISNEGKQKSLRVHRLVAQSFIKNEGNLPIVDHINRIKTDNNVLNLRWVDNVTNSVNKIEYKKGLYYCDIKEKWTVILNRKIHICENINEAFNILKASL